MRPGFGKLEMKEALVFACLFGQGGGLDLSWVWDWAANVQSSAKEEDSDSWIAGSGRGRPPLGPDLSTPTLGGRTVPVLELESFKTELFRTNFSHQRPFVLRGLAGRWPAARAWRWRSLADPGGPYAELGKVPALEAIFPPSGRPLAQEGALFLDGLLARPPLSEDCPLDAVSGQDGYRAGLLGENFLPRLNQAWLAALAKAKAEGLVDQKFEAVESIHNYFIAGPAGSGGMLHVDPEATAFWNALVHGRKRWMFLRPEDIGALAASLKRASGALLEQILKLAANGTRRPRQLSSASLRKLLQKIPALKWFGELIPLLRDAGINFPHEEVVVSGGDIVYGPPGVFHIVLSLEDSIGCSEQLVDEGNLIKFVRNEEEDFEPLEAFLGCAAARAHWPALLRPLEAFCARAERAVREAAAARLGPAGGPLASAVEPQTEPATPGARPSPSTEL